MEQKETEGDKQLYLLPLEIKLKHSTVHLDDYCPFIAPNPGVAAIHDYADWVREVSGDLAEIESEYQIESEYKIIRSKRNVTFGL